MPIQGTYESIGTTPAPCRVRHALFSRAKGNPHLRYPNGAFQHRTKDSLNCAAASSSGRPFEEFASTAKTGARQAGTAALEKLKFAFEVVDNNVRRTASQVNTKFDVSGKAQHAASQVSEQARVVESRIGVRRRLRNLADDVQRKWPAWQKSYAEFSRTPLGQFALFGTVIFLFYTGIAFRILNLLFILWWLAPFMLVPFTRYINKKAQEDMRRQAEAQKQARARANPFSNPFFSGRQQRAPPRGQAPRRYSDVGGGGPVIDVEYESIDDK